MLYTASGQHTNLIHLPVFYGHHHQASEEFGKKHYINVGSAGCHNKAEARCSILTFKETEHQLKTYSLPYKDGSLLEDYELRAAEATVSGNNP